VWKFLYDVYGGGPVLRRRTIQLYEPPLDAEPPAAEA
jgi:hypothetical protein